MHQDQPLGLMGISDVAWLLGVTRQRADQLSREGGFPDPIGTVNGRTRV
jgi:hypothetical protein